MNKRDVIITILVVLNTLFVLYGSVQEVYATETNRTCVDSSTLEIFTNKTVTTDGTAEVIEIREQKNCPAGCINGECKPTESNMPIEIYIFLCIVAVVLMILSFFKDDVLIIKWIPFILFLMLGVSSFNLNRIYCEYTTSGWDCYIHQYTGINLAFLWFGLGAVMFIYAFISSIQQPAQEIAKRV